MSFRSCGGLLKSDKIIVFRRCYVENRTRNVNSPMPESPLLIAQFAKIFGISWSRSRDIYAEHTKLQTTKHEEIESSIRTLESLNYEKKDLTERPALLYTAPVSIINRYTVLKECGCIDVSLGTLAKYIVIMNREIRFVKLYGLIPSETNVAQSLADVFTDIELGPQPLDDNVLLRAARESILNLYLTEKLHISSTELEKLWSSYYRMRNKSLKSIAEMIELVTGELHFSNDRIVKNGFVLYGDPENVRRIISEIPSIGGEDIREILYRRPKIMMSPYDVIQKGINHITSFGIPETSICKCIDVLTLASDTILERLQDMETIEEFRVLKSNPRILRLIHYQTKARLRLEYLNQLKVKCASLHVLSTHADAFVKYAKEGNDKGKGCDTVILLSDILKRPAPEIRKMISRHINWCHIPTVTIKQCYEFLVSKMFADDDIFHNLQILLYPIKRINEKLVYLQSNDSYNSLHLENVSYATITNRQMLALCLYLIELEFHFTGDAIWTDQDMHPVENFRSILPDFPESWQKGYKFGMKSSVNKLVNSEVAVSV